MYEVRFYALAWGATDYKEHPICETQTVAVGADAFLPTTEDGLPESMEFTDENGEKQTLYFAYWDCDPEEYTNVAEDHDIIAVYTPLVKLITYDKTGDDPDKPNEMQVACLSTPNLPPGEISEGGYSKAWFMSSGGELISDSPFELPFMEDTEIGEYEFTYTWYTNLQFTLQVDEETSYSKNYTLFCSKSKDDDNAIRYNYSLCVPLNDEEQVLGFWDMSLDDSGGVNIVFDESDEPYELRLDDFEFMLSNEGDGIKFEDLTSLLVESGDGPLLITGAKAELRISDDEVSDDTEPEDVEPDDSEPDD